MQRCGKTEKVIPGKEVEAQAGFQKCVVTDLITAAYPPEVSAGLFPPLTLFLRCKLFSEPTLALQLFPVEQSMLFTHSK